MQYKLTPALPVLLAALLAGAACAASAQAPAGVYVVTYFETVKVQPAPAAATPLAVLSHYRDNTAHEAGAVDVKVLGDVDRPGRYVVVEQWDSADSFKQHASAASTVQMKQDLAPWLAGPGDQRIHSMFQ